MTKKIVLEKWNNMGILKDKFFSLICFAPRHSGKSELIKYLYEQCDFGEEYDHVIVISESMETIDHYSNFVHGNLFFNKFESSILTNLIKESESLETSGKPKKFLLIIDDTIGNNVKNSQTIMQIYAIGRHYRISCILICQKLTLINTTVRNNSDLIFIGRMNNAAEKTSVRENLLEGIAEENEINEFEYTSGKSFYNAMIKENTQDYNFIVLDYLDQNRIDFKDVTFSFRADLNKK